ncbi:PorP/SprF family type IX secretion system membrane protein [Patiriisocius marinus]|uniref:PorP/SprF family type IX secretion system membrane protein n=2 Tax=Patiriisocius marinus TaxID=1397112 RepID=UPI00232C30FE|nr:type IX secretion system membrane protein PorP/SprF [Patiriisocius marinus]
MKRIITLITVLVLLVFTTSSFAQQDAQYTQYMYNTLSINPAYAGSRDVLSVLGLYRNQWFNNIEGAPNTYTFSIHSPFGKNVGLGLNVVRDEIFITNETYIDLAFSYTLNLSEEGRLNLGLKGGAHLLDVNFDQTNPFQNGDTQATAQPNIDNKFSPQFGLGAYYYTNKFYLGFSAPNVLETDHFDESSTLGSSSSNSSATAKEKVNFYLMSGYVFELNRDLDLKPSGLVKAVEGAPLQVDLSLNALIKDKLTLGVAYRWSAALSAMAGFQLSDELMLGIAYDRETTALNQFNSGSYEIFLRYELFKKEERMISPRFF